MRRRRKIADQGPGFNPELVPDCTDDEHIDAPNGRGIMLMRNYIADDSTFDFHKRKGPSTAMACKLCAGVMGTAVLKLLDALEDEAVAHPPRTVVRRAHEDQVTDVPAVRPSKYVAPVGSYLNVPSLL